MSMSTKEFQELLADWSEDIDLVKKTFQVSDTAAVILLIGDRIVRELKAGLAVGVEAAKAVIQGEDSHAG